MDKLKNIDTISMGLIYYPEHWPRAMWEDDLRRIREMGFSILRVGEFSWTYFEPEEGRYTFDFWDDFLALAERYGMRIIFGTPTATPPAWLTHRYPEVLNARRDGVSYTHGSRRHYNYNSPVYRRLCCALVEQIARRYGHHPAIIGWQIDNELNCEVEEFYSPCDQAAFRVWLRKKYETLDRLNEAWGTAFWNQQYSDWEQVCLTGILPSGGYNPHQLLDERRFISDSAIDFAMLQYDILKKHCSPAQFLSTNGTFKHLDYHTLIERGLDFIAYDSFPCFAFNLEHHPENDALNDRRWSWNMINTRAIRGNFAVFEQSSYAGGWICRMQGPSPKPGQLRLWTYQGFAHGAEYAGFYRWRSCSFGVEMYWHGMNSYANKPNRGYREIRALLGEVKRLAPVSGASYQARVAVLKDYDNIFDGEYDVWHGPHDYLSDDAWFTATQLTHTPCDFFYLREYTTVEELSRYRLLVYPHPTILTAERADLLRRYAEAGGTVIFGARTGYKDLEGHCPMQEMPGFAKELCGVEVEEFTFLGGYDAPQTVAWGGQSLPAPYFNDVLEPTGPDTEVLAVFEGNYYAGQPAVTRHAVGRGAAYYVGSVFSRELAEYFLRELDLASPFADLLELPEQCEVSLRQNGEDAYYFVLNYKEYPAQIEIKQPLYELLSGKSLSGWQTLEPYGVWVLTPGRDGEAPLS